MMIGACCWLVDWVSSSPPSSLRSPEGSPNFLRYLASPHLFRQLVSFRLQISEFVRQGIEQKPSLAKCKCSTVFSLVESAYAPLLARHGLLHAPVDQNQEDDR
ncbi:unnamed protein product [Heterobilharzia americana]|nr:unnamed protein product [Heterobilharzia americana]